MESVSEFNGDTDGSGEDDIVGGNNAICKVETSGCVFLQLDRRTTFDSALGCIKRALRSVDKNSVEYLHVAVYGGIEQSMTQEEMTRLVGFLARKFAKLEEIGFEGLPGNSNALEYDGEILPVSCLIAGMLPHMQQLQQLRVESINLAGSTSDFLDLADVTQSCLALEVIDISFSVHVQGPVDEDAGDLYLLDPFVSALSTLPDLQHAAIYGYRSLGRLQSETLRQLRQNKNLNRLELISFDFSDNDVVTLAGSMEGSPSVTELHFSCKLQASGGAALAKMLHGNQMIQELSLLDLFLPADGLYKDHSDSLRNLFQAIGLSKSLLRFELYTDEFDQQTRQALREAMRSNMSLENVHIWNNGDDSLEAEISFYTCLNCVGRSRLFRTDKPITVDVWIDLLIRCKDYPHLVYYFLSLNPSLCCSPSVRTNKNETKNKCRHRASCSQGSQAHKRRRLYRAAKYNLISYNY